MSTYHPQFVWLKPVEFVILNNNCSSNCPTTVPQWRWLSGSAETAASRVPAKFLVRVLASLLTEQAKDGFDSARWLEVRSHYCRLHTGLGLGLKLRLGLGLGLGSGP